MTEIGHREGWTGRQDRQWGHPHQRTISLRNVLLRMFSPSHLVNWLDDSPHERGRERPSSPHFLPVYPISFSPSLEDITSSHFTPFLILVVPRTFQHFVWCHYFLLQSQSFRSLIPSFSHKDLREILMSYNATSRLTTLFPSKIIHEPFPLQSNLFIHRVWTHTHLR